MHREGCWRTCRVRRRCSGQWGPARPLPSCDPRPSTGLRALPFLPDDLASKANILIDPLELQAATMDDLDEDQEPSPAAAQVPRWGRRGPSLRAGVSQGPPPPQRAPLLWAESHTCFPLPSPGNHRAERAAGSRELMALPLSTAAPRAGPGHWGCAAPAPARLAQLSDPGPRQPLPQHSGCDPDDPPAASERLRESEGPHAERRAEDPRGQ